MQCPKCGYTDALRVLVLGDGSAGKRHERMLRERGCHTQLIGPLATPSYFKHEGVRPIALMTSPVDAVVIASPPETHADYLQDYWHKCPILCEGPITWANPGARYVPFPHMTASNWLFVPQVQALKERIDRPFSQPPVSAQLWFDYDLAKWRGPGWDYQQSCYYTSGIDLINCHEAMTALHLFGPVDQVVSLTTSTGKSRGIDNISCVVRHTSNVLTTISAGWHSAQYSRGIRVVFKDGEVYEANWTSPQDDDVCNTSYGKMLDHWLAAINAGNCGVQPSLLDGFQAYKIMQGEC